MRGNITLCIIIILFTTLLASSFYYYPSTRTGYHELQSDTTMVKAKKNYQNFCSGCHGEQMQAFTDRRWKYGKTPDDLFKAIKEGYADDGMPSFDSTFSDTEINGLVDYIMKGIENVERYTFENAAIPSDTFKSSILSFTLDTIVSGLQNPWGMAFLPNGEMLVTERSGSLYLVGQKMNKTLIKGVPDVLAEGQGGLMDVTLHPDYAKNSFIYLSYSKYKEDKGKTLSTTAVMRAKLGKTKLLEQEIIFEALPYTTTRHHYGSRLEFDDQGYLFVSVGERGHRDRNPQNLDNFCGKIHRLNDDGSIPEDNPFVNKEYAVSSIYSFGHRNPQGLSFNHSTGELWEHEHGPRGGDEINIIKKGANYGWPKVSYGINYDGTTFTPDTVHEGMQQPELYWVPSIAPSGMTFVTGNKYPGWEGDLLVGSLRFKYLNRCIIKNNKIVKEEMLMKNIGRVRDVKMGSYGYIYVAVEEPGYIFKLIPL